MCGMPLESEKRYRKYSGEARCLTGLEMGMAGEGLLGASKGRIVRGRLAVGSRCVESLR